MSAFPPHRIVPSIPVTQGIALKFLSSYLEATKTSPHLLPNARLEASGPTSGSSVSSVTIHNLQRVETGLRGEWLAPTVDLDERSVKVAEGMDDGTSNGQDIIEEGQGDGWMDLDEYQREQSIEGGDLGNRLQGVAEQGDSDFEGLQVVEGSEEEDGVKGHQAKKIKTKYDIPTAKVSKPKDKEARKRDKKERQKQEKKMKHEKFKAAKLASSQAEG